MGALAPESSRRYSLQQRWREAAGQDEAAEAYKIYTDKEELWTGKI